VAAWQHCLFFDLSLRPGPAVWGDENNIFVDSILPIWCLVRGGGNVISREVVVSNKAGLHARAAMLLVQTAHRFTSAISIKKDDRTVNAKSIMGILTLAAVQGTTLELITDGSDEEMALTELENLFNRKFDEGE